MNFDKVIETNDVFDPERYILDFIRNVNIKDWLSDSEIKNKRIHETVMHAHNNMLTIKCNGQEYDYVKYECVFNIEFIMHSLYITIEKHFDIEGFIYKLVEFNITHKDFKFVKITLPQGYCLTIEDDRTLANIVEHIDLIQFSNNNIYFPKLFFNVLWNRNETFVKSVLVVLKEKHINLIFDNSNNGILLCLQRMNIPYKRRLMNEHMDIYRYGGGGCTFLYKGTLKHMFELL